MTNAIVGGSSVIVISGRDKGKKGKVLKILRKNRQCLKVVVSGVNMYIKHNKAKSGMVGTRCKMEKAISISNVAMFVEKSSGV